MTDEERGIFQGALPLAQDRIRFTVDVSETIRFLFEDIESWNADDALPKKTEMSDLPAILAAGAELVEEVEGKSQEEKEAAFKAKAEELDIKLGQLMQPIRVAVTGTKSSPPLFDSIGLLGKDKAIARINGLKAQIEASL